MPAETPTDSVIATRLDALLARCGARDRANIEKHLALCDAKPDRTHANMWRRLVTMLAELAPMPVTTVGTQALMFFIADGRFRMQVFALEDKCDGQILLYLPDIVDQAVKSKVLLKRGEEYVHSEGARKRAVSLAAIDAANTSDPPQHVKNLIGWNRKAIRVSIDAMVFDEQIGPAESLCALAAKQWAAAPAR